MNSHFTDSLKPMSHEKFIDNIVEKEPPITTKEMVQNLRNFIENFHEINDKNMEDFQMTKEENKELSDDINKTLKFGEFIAKKKNPNNLQNFKGEYCFRDILSIYRNKGYKIPNFNSNKNLFKPSALLMEQSQLKHFFKAKNLEEKKLDQKEIYFISKINNLLFDRLKELNMSVDPSKYKNLENICSYKLNNIINEFNFIEKKSLNTLKKQVFGLVNENKNAKEYISSNEEKLKKDIKIFEEKKNSQNNLNKKNGENLIHDKNNRRKTYDDFIKRISKPKFMNKLIIPETKEINNNKNNLIKLNSNLKCYFNSGRDYENDNSMVNIKKEGDLVNKFINKNMNQFKNSNLMNFSLNNFNRFGIINSDTSDNRDTLLSTKSTRVQSVFRNTNTSNFDLTKTNSSKNINNNFISSNDNILTTPRKNFSKLNILSEGNYNTEKIQLIPNKATKKNLTDSSYQEKFTDFLTEKEKLQELIETHLRSRIPDFNKVGELMTLYANKFSSSDINLEDLLNLNKKIEPTHLMKGINEIKNKIENCDLKEKYMDNFLSIGKFEQGNTLVSVK